MVFFAFMVSLTFTGAAQTLASDVLSQLNAYNVSWNSASTTGSMASMPLGNGDITANVWVESSGDLMMYIGKSDTWSEGTRLLKVGRLRINISPNPFVAGNSFDQTLNLYKGEIEISAGKKGSKVNLKVWIDANQSVLRVEASGDYKFSMKCTTELLRPRPFTLPSNNHPLAQSFRGVIEGNVKPSESADILMLKTNAVAWYHRNTSSMYQVILDHHNLSGLEKSFPDPYLNRTFGALMKGEGFGRMNDSTLQSSSSGKKFTLEVYPYTAQTNTVADWENQLSEMVAQINSQSLKSAYKQHSAWWDKFWNRSWIFVSGDDDAIAVTRGYVLQRFMEACMGRGQSPMKFNGGTLIFDYKGMNGDNRKWGPGFWNQNIRHLYWPLLGSGDFDMMMPWFDCYMNMLGIQTAVTKKLYGHDGAFFPETFNFFGLFILDDWGWNNSGVNSDTRWIRYHYSGALEVLAQMLDYYDYTRDDAFVRKYIAPFATQVIRFFDQHWKRVDGKILFFPANAIEEYWDCTNPVDYIAGLRYNISRLNTIKSEPITNDLLKEWNTCLAALPPIPITKDGSRVLPAEVYNKERNVENPACYTIFPFKFYGIGRENIEIGINTFNDRLNKGGTCWRQDPIQAPLLGLTDLAKKYILQNVKSVDPKVRFPAFWAPVSDYMPDLDNGGSLMMSLQNMLIQSVGNKIYLTPAWPASWSVDCKLNAPDQTIVRFKSNGKVIRDMVVLPKSRATDVVVTEKK
jgi:hypothetical protein